MTSSYIPSGVQQSSSYDFLRQQQANADKAALDALDDDEEYRKREEARAAEIERQKAAEQDQQQKQAVDAAGKASPPNPLQEIGTAVVGAGIDAAEGIGSTAEAAVTGQMLNPNFKPTWLQMADEVEQIGRAHV